MCEQWSKYIAADKIDVNYDNYQAGSPPSKYFDVNGKNNPNCQQGEEDGQCDNDLLPHKSRLGAYLAKFYTLEEVTMMWKQIQTNIATQ